MSCKQLVYGVVAFCILGLGIGLIGYMNYAEELQDSPEDIGTAAALMEASRQAQGQTPSLESTLRNQGRMLLQSQRKVDKLTEANKQLPLIMLGSAMVLCCMLVFIIAVGVRLGIEYARMPAATATVTVLPSSVISQREGRADTPADEDTTPNWSKSEKVEFRAEI